MNSQNQPSNTSFFRSKWELLQEKWTHFRETYPRSAKGVKIVGGLSASGIFLVLLLCLLVYFGAFGKLPSQADLRAIQNHTASEIYSEDGVLLGKYYVENRINVSFEAISPSIVQALIATEDARFFQHKGVDLRSWGRVLFKTVLMGDESSGGGSTISQQLAKNIFHRQRYRFLSIPITKLKEMFIARRLERVYSKDELINLYLNTVPFGGNMFGVEVAARQLFNTSAKDIKTEQAAVLVGMLKGNTYYSPVRNPERSLRRRNTVLKQMLKYNYLDATTVDSLKELPLELAYRRENKHEGMATYFREHLRQDLEDRMQDYVKEDGEPYNIYKDGLKIYTTIDSRLQRYAEESVAEQMKALQKAFDQHWKKRKPWGNDKVITQEMKRSRRYKSLSAAGNSETEIKAVFEQPIKMTVFSWDGGDEEKEMSPLDSIRYYYCLLNAGFSVMDPSSGALRAWVGGIDHQYFQYDHVKSRRQVGSTFKPIIYANALERGITPCEYIHNRLVIYSEYDDWKPQNSDGEYGGVYSMEGGLRESINSIAVNLIMQTGVDSVIQLAQSMGVTSEIPDAPAIALGAVDVSLFDMLSVYATLANRGARPDVHYLTRVERSDGTVIAEFDIQPAEQVMNIATAETMVEIMQSVVDSGTAKRLRYKYQLPGEIAGKTGTTQGHADGWFMGFTPKLVAGAWVGGESRRVHFRSLRLGQGANTALPIWGRFMKKVYKDAALKKYRGGDFPAPSEEVMAALDCDPYLEEMPLFAEDLDLDDLEGDSFDSALKDLLGVFKKDKNVNISPEEARRRKATAAEAKRLKESERIRKKNEKLKKKKQRKKKRKEFWNRLFKKN